MPEKDNTVTPYQMSLIIEGLTSLILKSKEARDSDKVVKIQQTIDQLQDYTQNIWKAQENK